MDDVTLGNWLEDRSLGRSLHRVEELLATAPIARGQAAPRAFRVIPQRDDPSVAEFCTATHTDAMVVVRGEDVVFERYFGDMTAATRHIAMSVSKSICGMLAGVLAGEGVLDLGARTAAYVPELSGGPYGSATVSELLDMTAALKFDMNHADPDSAVDAEDRAAGWRPRRAGEPVGSRNFLQTLQPGHRSHGEVFQYSSATTEVLGWVLERAAGVPYPQLVSDRLWSRMGAGHDAYVTVDAFGTAYACAGLGMTLLDLARFGRLVLDEGGYRGEQVIPAAWISQTFSGSSPALIGQHSFAAVHPHGSYRNQWWVTGDAHGSVHALGWFGQYLWLDPVADVVIAKFSRVPIGADNQRARHASGFRAIAAAYGRAPSSITP